MTHAAADAAAATYADDADTYADSDAGRGPGTKHEHPPAHSHPHPHPRPHPHDPQQNERWTFILVIHVLLRALDAPHAPNHHSMLQVQQRRTAKAIIRDCIAIHKRTRRGDARHDGGGGGDGDGDANGDIPLSVMMEGRLRQVNGMSQYLDRSERCVRKYWVRRTRKNREMLASSFSRGEHSHQQYQQYQHHQQHQQQEGSSRSSASVAAEEQQGSVVRL